MGREGDGDHQHRRLVTPGEGSDAVRRLSLEKEVEGGESVRRWRDGADARNAKDVKDRTIVSKEEATGHEKSGARRKRQARARESVGQRQEMRRVRSDSYAQNTAARTVGSAKMD